MYFLLATPENTPVMKLPKWFAQIEIFEAVTNENTAALMDGLQTKTTHNLKEKNEDSLPKRGLRPNLHDFSVFYLKQASK